MNREEVIDSFLVLKEVILNLNAEDREELYASAAGVNPWYTAENIQKSFDGIDHLLDEGNLRKWAAKYPAPKKIKRVGLILAGNIPMVGFHDLLCTLVSGHKAIIKLSSQDEVLPKFLLNELVGINPELSNWIEVVDKLNDIDAVIATGSDNSSRYFRKYFKDYPHIIRKNRTSIAILTGEETSDQLDALGEDIFRYFGMGCRNVSKILIPKDYNMAELISHFEKQNAIAHHPKYFNNYEYNKAIYLVNRVDHLDNGFALFTNSQELVSPLSVVYYDQYESITEAANLIKEMEDKLQCVVGMADLERIMIPFGQAQSPNIDDYADNIDTMKFLTEI